MIETLGEGPGVFVDVGAYDGLSTSNTLCLETDYGWTGVCIEPDPAPFRHLAATRSCTCVNVAASDQPGEVVIEPSGLRCPAVPLTFILDGHINGVIDYLSIDVEGAEMAVLRGMDFNRWHVRTITIEHNAYRDGDGLQRAIYAHLTGQGFARVAMDVGCIDPCPPPAWVGCPFEDWYVNRRESGRT